MKRLAWLIGLSLTTCGGAHAHRTLIEEILRPLEAPALRPTAGPVTVTQTIWIRRAVPVTLPEAPPAYTAMTSESFSDEEQATFDLINELRTRGTLNGQLLSGVKTACHPQPAPALTPSDLLARLAQGQARYLAFNGNDAGDLHKQRETSPLFFGADFTARNRAVFAAAGASDFLPRVRTNEDVTAFSGYNGSDGPVFAIKNWLASPGHCKDLFDPAMKQGGVGHATGQPAERRYADNYVLVMGGVVR